MLYRASCLPLESTKNYPTEEVFNRIFDLFHRKVGKNFAWEGHSYFVLFSAIIVMK